MVTHGLGSRGRGLLAHELSTGNGSTNRGGCGGERGSLPGRHLGHNLLAHFQDRDGVLVGVDRGLQKTL
jgi:hypothetical protein